MYLEYDPAHSAYWPKDDSGKSAIINGRNRFSTLKEVRRNLKQVGLALGDRINMRTRKIIRKGEI